MEPPRWQVHWRPKAGSTEAEYEDAFGAAPGRLASSLFAVADGATESSYSREWAEALVTSYRDGASWKPSFVRALPSLQSRWRADHLARTSSWYAEQKVQQGAFAAFLGVRLLPRDGHYRLHGLAVGDCELAHLSGGAVHCTFPLAHSADFGIHPVLIGTGSPVSEIREMARGRREDVHSGDVLLLMSDAIAAWFLGATERGEEPWHQVLALEPGDADDFRRWVDGLWASGRMRNDDVTLGIVRVP